MADTIVRMGEYAAASQDGDVLVTLGLGSCIGVALMDARLGIVGLAHVMLPDSSAGRGDPGKFADTAIPALVCQLEELGARTALLEAAIAGGAQMFTLGNGRSLDIGVRNEAAVRETLGSLRIPVKAAATSGGKGRTIRVHAASGLVTVRTSGEPEENLWVPGRARAAA